MCVKLGTLAEAGSKMRGYLTKDGRLRESQLRDEKFRSDEIEREL